ncbi:MAG: sulfurtransferase [Halobacteria archaeon]|nr:sulfurtransferase [Halobacteria archaeon]
MSYIEEIEVAELQQQLVTGAENIQLIDVRRPAEIIRGMIPGADRLPLHLIPENLNQLARDRMVVLYCQVGARSARACAYLAGNGFENVYNLRGGIQAWTNSGLMVA